MTSPTLTSPTSSPLAARPVDQSPSGRADGRLAGLALMAGCLVTALGFVAISLAVRGGEARYTDPQWVPLYGIALAGNVLVVLGLPAVLAVHSRCSRRLTLIGYVGIFAPLVMLNVAETSIEAFVKPYLSTHGGVPQQDPTGLAVFEGVALLLLILGCGCLAAAVFRARVLPRWVGVALLACVPLAFVLHTVPAAFVSDFCILAALFRFGLAAFRPQRFTD
jgi:hypothetical protein